MQTQARKRGDNVVELPRNIDLNKMFFHKSMVHVGCVFLYLGRMAPNSRWECKKIVTRSWRKGNAYQVRSVERCEHLSDDITIFNLETQEVRTMEFGYMSYSAIWCLE